MKNSFKGVYKQATQGTIENPKVKEIVAAQKPDINDPTGSWTGKPVYKNEHPQQDADDL